MLKAWLHRKLRLARLAQDDTDEEGPDPERISALEDPLTSAVFERLSYLEPPEAWSLLHAAWEGTDRARLPDAPPAGVPEWSFWPSLSPGAGGSNARRVEPDVLVTWGDLALVIEAKHQGAQYEAQWVEEVRAVRSCHAGKRVVLVAVGGVNPAMFEAQAALARRALGDHDGPYLFLRWEALRKAAEDRLLHEARPGTAAILRDLVTILDAWGYRRLIDFASLPEAAAPYTIQTTPTDLATWSLK